MPHQITTSPPYVNYLATCDAQHDASMDAELTGDKSKFHAAYERCKRAKVRDFLVYGSSRRFHDGIPQNWIDEEYHAYHVELFRAGMQAQIDKRGFKYTYRVGARALNIEKHLKMWPHWFRWTGAQFVAILPKEEAKLVRDERRAKRDRHKRHAVVGMKRDGESRSAVVNTGKTKMVDGVRVPVVRVIKVSP